MWQTWIDFARSVDIAQDSIPFDHDQWFAWLDHAGKHYQEPLKLTTASDWNDK